MASLLIGVFHARRESLQAMLAVRHALHALLGRTTPCPGLPVVFLVHTDPILQWALIQLAAANVLQACMETQVQVVVHSVPQADTQLLLA